MCNTWKNAWYILYTLNLYTVSTSSEKHCYQTQWQKLVTLVSPFLSHTANIHIVSSKVPTFILGLFLFLLMAVRQLVFQLNLGFYLLKIFQWYTLIFNIKIWILNKFSLTLENWLCLNFQHDNIMDVIYIYIYIIISIMITSTSLPFCPTNPSHLNFLK